MTDSLKAHCILTEPVLGTMSGKGREGKGIRKGREVREDFHHIVTLGNARIGATRAGRPRDVMVSATRIDTDLTTIEHLDFDPTCTTAWCEDSADPNPANYLIEVLEHLPHIAPTASVGDVRTVCAPCWKRVKGQHIGLCACGEVTYWNQLWRITEVLR